MPNVKVWKHKGITYDLVSKVDTSLTQEEIPADSKTVGDKFTELNAKVDNLDLSGGAKVFNADTHFDFPSIGSIDFIYKAYKEKKVYQWNEETMVYEPLNETTIDNVKLINGGNADGTFN